MLLIIDPQVGFVTTDAAHRAVEHIRWELDTGAYDQVLVTTFQNLPNSPFTRMGWEDMQDGDPRNELVPELRDLPLPVATKFVCSTYFHVE